jgi:hypothetical protein
VDNSTAVVIGAGAAIVGGVLGGLFSGASLYFLDWLKQPMLHLDYEGKDDVNKIESDYDACVYIRARVRNSGLRVAKKCRVFLATLTEVHNWGNTATAFNDSMPLPWAGWDFAPRDLPKGADFYVDLMKVSKNDSGWLISVEKLLASHAKLKDYSGTYRFQLLATADNALPVTYEIDVEYHQNWKDLRAMPAKLN